MLKKLIFFTALISSLPCYSASPLQNTLTIAPDHPEAWGYMNASVTIDNGTKHFVGNHITLPVAPSDQVNLDVYAMNVRPKLDLSCQGIRVMQPGHHQISFQLEPDWLIHCNYQ